MNGLHCTRIKNISVDIENEHLVEDVSFDLCCGELTMLIGSNGAGKTTILKAILNEIPHKGEIDFIDTEKNKHPKIKIGYVPQSIKIEKNMPLTVYDLFASFISNKPVWLYKDKNLYSEIELNLKKFGAESLIDKQAGKLSGGELQRVLLAIATTPTPDLLILDEPVSGIDRKGTMEFYKILSELKEKYDMTILLVSHDLDLVKKFADNVILLDKTLLKKGKPEEVFKSDEFIERFGTSFAN